MKTNLSLFLILIYFIIDMSVSSQEVEFEASKIDISNNGKIIFAFNSTAEIAKENIEIKSKKAKYSKQNEKKTKIMGLLPYLCYSHALHARIARLISMQRVQRSDWMSALVGTLQCT